MQQLAFEFAFLSASYVLYSCAPLVALMTSSDYLFIFYLLSSHYLFIFYLGGVCEAGARFAH